MLEASNDLSQRWILPAVSGPDGSGDAWARLAVVTTDCPHHWVML